MYSKTLFALAASLGSVAAHMAIQQPPPFPDSMAKDPLLPSGANFPCQGSALTGGTVTQMAAGSSQPLQFNLGNGQNTAVHGGGSCQISLGYGSAADLKSASAWKVIHTFIGGCPTEAMGNLVTAVACPESDPQCVNQGFTFNIPNEVKSGNAVLAWTWFNNVGNREMYMNCAPVSITGGTNQMDSLPALFTANIGNGCSTTEDYNTDIPNPGAYVTKSALNFPLKAPVGNCGSGSGSANIPSANVTTPAAAPAAAAPSAAKSSPSAGVFAEGGKPAAASGSPAAQPTTLATAPAAAASTAAAAAPAAASPAASGACPVGSVACSGQNFYCVDDTHFGLCNFGCAVVQPVAAGTQCSGNTIKAAKLKTRHMQKRNFFNI